MGTEQAVNPLLSLPIIPYILIFFIFWLLVIKPQRDKEKERKNMVQNLLKDDRVITAGGMHGRVVQVKEKTVVIRVDDNAKIEFDKESISTVVKSKTKE